MLARGLRLLGEPTPISADAAPVRRGRNKQE